MNRLILAATAALAVSACATAPTLYQPAAGRDAVGYSEYRIEPGRYRITFRGGPGAPPEQVSDYALLRAADLALADGYDWFRVSDRFLEGQPDRGPRLSVGVGGASFGRRSAVGVGVSQGIPLGGGPSLASTIEVVMGKGDRPRGADIYDARALRASIGART
ncbi:hypothetical protein [uncultured Phenylobacterium sp.]|uniref:CC0125/CC1285 family lipoprotein n=1 Tax=uncultured Phenylobacterium sp. TaxID=349273 RepID=UPI0025DD7FB1|nr:hypothetical protein [uncultured Phenylobacterium sp.]